MSCGLTKLHMLPTGQTLSSEYYIKQILEKEVKPLISRHQVTGGLIGRKLFSSKKEMTVVQEEAPAHIAKATQTWCQKNLPHFIAKDGWPVNSPDLNPIENIWSIIDETMYKDHPTGIAEVMGSNPVKALIFSGFFFPIA